jgi:stage II sporulation protein D
MRFNPVSFILLILFLSAYAFGDEYSLDTFGPVLKVGITRLQSKKLYVNSENGRYTIILDGKELVKESGDKSCFEYKNGEINFENSSYKKVELKKKDVFSLLSFSKNDENYSRYRGEFVLEYKDNMIFPINFIQAEEYLYSVVPSEIGYKFYPEAIKAQAVAARSYLYHSLLKKRYNYCDLLDTVDSQVYLGYDKENSRINEFINETSNIIMVYNGEAINALFHSTSGGRTANNEDVWPRGTPLPYIRAVNDDGNGDESPRQNWNFSISKKEMSRIFGFTVKSIKVVETADKRVKKVRISGDKTITITGNDLRKNVGYTKIFSTMFRIKDKDGRFYFDGHGSGHGLGMPQWSANGLAKKGKKYQEILKYYYTGVDLKQI